MHKTVRQHVTTERSVLTHVMVDLYGVGYGTLNSPDRIAQLLTDAATMASLHPLAEPAIYRYPGQGLTAFLPIRESHFSIHTYPEHGYASVDIVSCAVAERAERARDFMVDELEATRVETRIVRRGFLAPD